MVIKLRKREDGITVLFDGRLDANSAPEAQEALLQLVGQYPDIILDFERLSYVSSAGLRIILMLQKQLNKAGKTLTVDHAKPEVKEVFEMTGFASILNIT